MNKNYDPIKAYLDDFYSLPMLIVVVAGMCGLFLIGIWVVLLLVRSGT